MVTARDEQAIIYTRFNFSQQRLRGSSVAGGRRGKEWLALFRNRRFIVGILTVGVFPEARRTT
jgi:hypothetical protein